MRALTLLNIPVAGVSRRLATFRRPADFFRRRKSARRSALYLPGSNARALQKARELPADVVILDLEDAVSPDNKALARSRVMDALVQKGGFGDREVVVRINSLDTEWGMEDIRSLANPNLHLSAILLPKAESVEAVALANDALAKPIGGGGGSSRGSGVAIWCMIETPLGVLRAESIAADPRVGCLVAGTSDLSADLRCDGAWEGRAALLHSLSHTVLAARAAGIGVLDGVHLDINDLAGFEASCVQGRALGFDGKTLIHPSTIGIANTVFAPSASEVARARRVIAAFEEAAAAGSALAVLDGKLLEQLHVRESERLLALASAIEDAEGGPPGEG